jgi:hypothetical protein
MPRKGYTKESFNALTMAKIDPRKLRGGSKNKSLLADYINQMSKQKPDPKNPFKRRYSQVGLKIRRK